MEQLCCGLLTLVVLLQMDCLHSVYITDDTDLLQDVLSEFAVFRPIRTDSEGRFLSLSVSAPPHKHRNKRYAPSTESTSRTVKTGRDTQQAPPTPARHDSSSSSFSHRTAVERVELFYNVTVFGQELHLRLRPNLRLVAPAATMEWEELGRHHSQPIGDAGCFYTGTVSNMANTSIAISNCDGLAGMIRTADEEFFIEPLDQWRPGGGGGGGKGEEEAGRQHIIYRSSAVIRNQAAASQAASDSVRAPLLGSVDLNQKMVSLRSGSNRRRRYIAEAELFNIEVLLAVDYSVLLFHGREQIQMYLLTLMNIVNEIYQDPSLGANMNVVLVRIIVLSATKSQELISVGNPQKSLENVCGWSFLQQREQSHAEQHDHTIYLTRQEFGPSGMQGYAPVTGMCHLHRSCVLVLEDGFTSSFVAAHETGHVLGMEHDGEANDCADDVLFGSIMSPRVQATFRRYHWSRCSWRELHQYLHTYDCLRDDPFNHEWPSQPQLPGFQYSMDQQCRFDFGPGFGLCTAYPTPEPCKQLWCSDNSNPFYCRTKKGPPLDGTKCGPGKHCFKGFCIKLTPDLLRQDGSWGTWSLYGSCSRTCGGGVKFRTRRCDNPLPANGGRTCFGNSFEFQLCGQEDCPPLTDFREDQCKVWNPFFEHEGQKHHWLPYQHPDPDERCRLYCQSKETAAVVSMNRIVHDGTPCSYSDSFSVCVRGECEHVGCDGQIASDRQEDRCGVCGGDNSSCKIIKGNFTRSTKKKGFLKILEIPKGARHLLVQEFKKTPHILAMKNQETGDVFLNDEDTVPKAQIVIEKGVIWEYGNATEQEYIQTAGPLRYDVLLMVRSHSDSKVTVSYKYVLQDRLRSSLESNLVQDDSIFYEWALKRWSSCSKPCGGGKQYTRFGCRRKADSKMVHRTFCFNVPKPRAISRSCNTEACLSPRWQSGDWQPCSASCGHTGWQRRWVSCQQESSRGQQRSVNSKLCSEKRPDAKQPCNRLPCPPSWRAGPWSPCSVTCGNGTQERQIACSKPEGSVGNCSEPQPITTHSCQAPPCSGDQRSAIIQWLSRANPDFPTARIFNKRCRGDRSVFCTMEVLSRYCSIPGYRQMCCKSCSQGNFSNSATPSGMPPLAAGSTTPPTDSIMASPTGSTEMNSPGTSQTTMLLSTSSWSDSSYDIIDDIITTPPPTTAPQLSTSTDFVYVEYDDYDDYLSHKDPSDFTTSTFTPTVAASSTASPTVITTTRDPRKTALQHLFTKKSPTTPAVEVPTATVENQSALVVRESLTPTVTSPTATGGRSPHITTKWKHSDPAGAPLRSLVPLLKKDNNSVDEVAYRIVGLDGEVGRGQQNLFVPRMPRIHERTQNKRIQQLLNEKRRQDVLKRSSRTDRSR